MHVLETPPALAAILSSSEIYAIRVTTNRSSSFSVPGGVPTIVCSSSVKEQNSLGGAPYSAVSVAAPCEAC